MYFFAITCTNTPDIYKSRPLSLNSLLVYEPVCLSWLSGGSLLHVTILGVVSSGVKEEASGRILKGHWRLLCLADGSTPPLGFVFLSLRGREEEPGLLSAGLLYYSLGGTLIKVMQSQWRELYPGSLWTVRDHILIMHQ